MCRLLASLTGFAGAASAAVHGRRDGMMVIGRALRIARVANALSHEESEMVVFPARAAGTGTLFGTSW